MPLVYRLEDYARYRQEVGAATVIDLTRRTDPARMPAAWERLGEILSHYGPPWVVQLWTKDVAGCLRLGGDVLRALVGMGTTITAQVTVTGLAGTPWEPRVPPDGWRALPHLAAIAGGPMHLKWRYDPIIPTVHTPETFCTIARRMASLGITQGVINFIAPPGRYKRVDRRLKALLPAWGEGMRGYDAAWRLAIARELVAIAAEEGIALACCAEYAALHAEVRGLGRAACGDYDWFVRLSGRDPGCQPYRGSRPGCGCARYFDIGSYGRWARCHRCVYCYAG